MALSDGSNIAHDKRLRLLELQPELRKRYHHELPAGVLLFECPVCGVVYPLCHFALKPDTRYGIRAICRACRRVTRTRTRYDPNPDLKTKYCHGCLRRHPIGEFYVDRSQDDGHSSVCRTFARERKAAALVARHHTTVERVRREQTIRVCAELGLDVPDYDLKQCLHCRAVKPLDEFGNDWHRADRKRATCLDCRA